MKYIRDNFSGPIKLYLKIKLSAYNNIEQMLDDIKRNFMVRTPLHLLENKIYSTSQNLDESVKEFGARLADLQNLILNRLRDKFRGNINTLNSKIAEIETKIKKQLIQGLKRDLYVQFSLVDFRNNNLDQIIQSIAKSEYRNKINENFEKSSKKVNFQQDKLNSAELVEALTVAISTADRSRNRNVSYADPRYRDYSRENYNNRRNSRDRNYSQNYNYRNRERSYSRDRKNSRNQSRENSYDRKARNYSRDRYDRYKNNRNYSNDRRRSPSRENYYHNRRNYNRSRDSSYNRRENPPPRRNNSMDRKCERKNSEERKHENGGKRRENSRTHESDSDDSSRKNA